MFLQHLAYEKVAKNNQLTNSAKMIDSYNFQRAQK